MTKKLKMPFLIRYFLPQNINSMDSEIAKTFHAMNAIFILCSLVTLVLFPLNYASYGESYISFTMVILSIFIGALFATKKFGSLTISMWFLNSLPLVIIPWMQIHQGILNSNQVHWLFCVPLLNALILGVKHAWIATSIIIIEYMIVAQFTEIAIFTTSGKNTDVTKLMEVGKFTFQLLFIMVLTHLFKNSVTRMSQKLKDSRDQAIALSKSKSKFLAIMSHEIRTPLNGIIGNVEMLKELKIPEDSRRKLSTILSTSENLIHVLNDILDFSQIESGNVKIDPKPFDLYELVETSVDSFKWLATKKKLSLEVEVDPKVPRKVIGDKNRLLQVLNNLIFNAIKFTEVGQIRVMFYQKAENFIGFRIKDSGPGMSRQQLETLFTPFSRKVSETYDSGNRGGGLGLSISKSLIEQMGGQIRGESQVGKGTTFEFSCILPEAKESEAAKPSLQENFPKDYEGKILVIDDNGTNLAVAKSFIEMYGPKVTAVLSGKEALECVKKNSYDIILVDIIMPEMDGIETSTEIFKLQPNQKIFALTAIVSKDELQRCFEVGLHGIIPKPLRRARIEKLLQEHLERKITSQGAKEKAC